jgi:hypothetical protein
MGNSIPKSKNYFLPVANQRESGPCAPKTTDKRVLGIDGKTTVWCNSPYNARGMESPRPASLADDSYRQKDGRSMLAKFGHMAKRAFIHYLQALRESGALFLPRQRPVPMRLRALSRHRRG